MATADEILAGAVEVASEDVTQDKVLRIDNELRTIAIPSTVKLLGVESDEDVNRLEFEMPRHYGEFDLSTFSVRVNYMNANGDGDIYKVTDLVADEEKMNFSWLVGRTAFMYKGDVQFVVCLKKIAEDFVVEQEFNTTIASLPVLEGLEPSEQLMQEYPDIIEQILKYMETPVSSEEIGKAVEEYLKENPVGGATINDDEISTGSVWSSQKTSLQIDAGVSEHNTDQTTHADIRNLIVGLTNRLNALADSDDTTLDQLSEIVAYIKNNKGLIDAITTSKVSVSDIVNDLITNVIDKPLSAAQGVELKRLIDTKAMTVDEALSPTSTNPVQNKAIFNAFNSITPPIDETLTQSGKAADAKKTGDEISQLKSDKLGKDETAADSAKLGGKAPEYYLQPRNLLDNSDFTNPVNQRNAGTVVNDYVVDRWCGFKTTDGSVSITPDGITATGDGYLQHRLPSGTLKSGVVYTIAVYYSDGSIDVNTNGEYAIMDQFDIVNYIKPNGKTIAHVALYEGTYTADTLPPYVPKGYAAELAECQRYYKHFINNAFLGTAIVSGDGVLIQGFIPLDTPMRINNPAIIGTLAFYESTQNQALGTPTTFVQQGNGIRCNFSMTTSLTVKSVGFINTLSEVGISADL